MTPFPKPVKRATLKARKQKAKTANIRRVRNIVFDRDYERCRVPQCITHQSSESAYGFLRYVELAHIDGRGMGGNQDLSRDTTANTICCCAGHHRSGTT